jgi:hypothetical protein
MSTRVVADCECGLALWAARTVDTLAGMAPRLRPRANGAELPFACVSWIWPTVKSVTRVCSQQKPQALKLGYAMMGHQQDTLPRPRPAKDGLKIEDDWKRSCGYVEAGISANRTYGNRSTFDRSHSCAAQLPTCFPSDTFNGHVQRFPFKVRARASVHHTYCRYSYTSKHQKFILHTVS